MPYPIIRKGQSGVAELAQSQCSFKSEPSAWYWHVQNDNGSYVASQNEAGGYTGSPYDPARFDPAMTASDDGAIFIPNDPAILPGLHQLDYRSGTCELNPEVFGPGAMGWENKIFLFIVGCLAADPVLSHTEDGATISVTVATTEDDSVLSFAWYRLAESDPAYGDYDSENPATYGTSIGSARTISGQPSDNAMYTCVITLNECYEFEPGWSECYPLCEEVASGIMGGSSSAAGWNVTVKLTEFCPGDEIEVFATEAIEGEEGAFYAEADDEFTTALVVVALLENLTPSEPDFSHNYKFTAPALAAGDYRLRVTTEAEVTNPFWALEMVRSAECAPTAPTSTTAQMMPFL